ncbi:hypothetical protein GTY68_30970 [Streptomyces sp. SID4926]|nr:MULTISPECIES: DUF6542 domain-containing protein [unclassified Streptomyces]MYQ61577.1 hypothetical protein [Streptomyces sp. SID4926]WEH27558.1 hypothetical protein P0D76_09605 [Streptomyces sp. AM 3-1-1]
MEQPSTRRPPDRPSPRPPAARPARRPLPPQGAQGRGGRPRPPRRPRTASGATRTPSRVPGPRLTGLGTGLFAAAAMLLASGLALAAGSSVLVYGLLFLPVSVLTALWVRPADLFAAPVAVPIAFAVGLAPLAESEGGLAGHAVGVVTALAVHAGWLYAGTAVAVALVMARKVRMVRRRAAASARGKGRPPG